MKKKKNGLFNLNLISFFFRREYGVSTFLFFGIPTIYINLFCCSFIRLLEEWYNDYEVIMSLTDAAVMFGPFSESFISLRNMDKFCVNLK
jgi:hypothetical protein